MRQAFYLLLVLTITGTTYAQDYGKVVGTVTDDQGNPVKDTEVYRLGFSGTITDVNGKYELVTTAGQVSLVFKNLTFKYDTIEVNIPAGEVVALDVELKFNLIPIDTVVVNEERIDREVVKARDESGGVTINVKETERIPSITGGLESMLASSALGASLTNELSSQYSVRGGNFDENLVYVNGFEIRRPYLIRSGQQEGMSFINVNMVEKAYFSSGGFQPKYGDKLSSVLDVTYKKPLRRFGGSVQGSLLGGSAHIEGSTQPDQYESPGNFTYLAGVRFRSNQYILNSLETEGEYSPTFVDVQTYLTYQVSEKIGFEWLVNYARNQLDFKPTNRETTFGVVNNVLRLTVFFEGNEADSYETLMSGFAMNHKFNDKLKLKYLVSIYRATEVEAFSILGEYFLDEVESDFGNDNFGQTRFSLGVGAIHDWARNRLESTIANGALQGEWDWRSHKVLFGARYQREIIQDQINEWEVTDSSGFAIPYTGSSVAVTNVLKSSFDLNSNRVDGFIQDTWTIDLDKRQKFTYGARFTYWDVNKEFLVSPRAQYAIKVETKKAEDVVFTFASGLYFQPPFYREMRDLDGNVNLDLRAQKSLHVAVGADVNFKVWNRNFNFITEVYYKYLWDMVPYEFDNVLIRYFGQNRSTGYAAGVDFRLSGEFIKGTDSYISMSIMSTQEDLAGDVSRTYFDSTGSQVILGTNGTVDDIVDTVTTYPGNIPRPTDQRVRFAMFFQDHLPRNENFKMHLNLIFATGLPFGPPDRERFRDVLRVPFYRRVDIGFSAQLYDVERKKLPPKNFFKHMDNIWLTLEIWNLLGVNNTVSYLWVKDFSNTVYAVPNFLSARRINARLIVKF